ncbi:MAG TPA: FkbM family methyltransferase [Ignavibacteria bacterium]|nr:FkbM family methyltransferase [Ignavibacteria bacterium]HMQ97438.1 FkbM family methyltransferase [Ignavibacteria bacterium]
MIKKLTKFIKVFGNSSYRKAAFIGAAAGIEHEAVLKTLNCSTIIDIGANKGQFALAARKCLPMAKIYSFEPLAHPAEIFNKVFVNDSNIKLFPFAISDETGEAEIHISHREDSSSLLPIGEKQNEMFPGTYEVGVEKITMKKLSDTLSASDLISPVLMKIDVQGFELSVLKGSTELFSRIKYIYSECSYIELYKGQALLPEISDFLAKHGFKRTGEFNTSFDESGKPVQSDFLFENFS